MNYFDLYSSYPDHTIAAAWDSQVKEADKSPWLAGTLTECGDELFARFAACYAELRALPRSARRALQRQLARSTEVAAILPEYLQQGGRRLQHRMAWSLAGAALLLALGQGVATAATITVTTDNPNIISDGQCSLIEAIVNANNDVPTHADCPAGGGADTIVLPANANVMLSNVYCRYTNTPYCGPVGLPPITSQITIEGNGAVIHRQEGAAAFGLIAVRGNFPSLSTPGDLTLQSVTLSGGSSFGGLLNNGTARIKNSIISGNTAIFRGGGISNYGTLFIENSTISGNTANFDHGGGIYNYIYNYSGSSGSVTIENSTISNNTANFAGGGIYNLSGRLTITNSTISGNRANHGGGVYNSLSTLGGAGTLTLNNSLIAGNQAVIAPEIQNFSRAIVNANNFNLFGTNGNAGVSGFTPGPTDIVPSVSVEQILGPLKNNGGPNPTHALVAGSPAIDAGNPGGCRKNSGALLKKDQRGLARNVDGNNDGTARCDIGAVEFGAGSATLVDFDGDGESDAAVYEESTGNWFVVRSSSGFFAAALNFGGIGFLPVPGDYDGDGAVDTALYEASTGNWFVVGSTAGFFTPALNFGGSGFIPVSGDYDGDGKTDVAVYQQSTGNWFVVGSTAGLFTPALNFGGSGFIPVPGDYDGDGKTDVAVYGTSNGNWFVVGSTAGLFTPALNFGGSGFIPVPGDYDGDGKTDVAVYGTSNGNWFVVGSTAGFFTPALNFGGSGFIPVPGDYDGDGATDTAVYQASTGNWFIEQTAAGFRVQAGFGGLAFVPVLPQVTILRALGLL